jgi:hypothetical protein
MELVLADKIIVFTCALAHPEFSYEAGDRLSMIHGTSQVTKYVEGSKFWGKFLTVEYITPDGDRKTEDKWVANTPFKEGTKPMVNFEQDKV